MNSLPFHHLRHRIATAMLAALVLALPAHAEVAAASAPADHLAFLAGQSFRNPADSQDFAYLRWRGQPPATATIYVKSGAANATGTFTAVGTLAPQTRSTVIATIANSMPAAVFNPATFHNIIDSFFGEFIPAFNLTLEDKLAMLIPLSQDDARVRQRLESLAIAEPFLSVCMGLGAIVPMPAALATFELRSGSPEVVIARVTIDAQAGNGLPAPPAPIQIVETGATGHLNVKLRWDETPNMLRASPQSFGYDVYRIEKSFAESVGFHLNPPDPEIIAPLRIDMPDDVKRINEGAILITDRLNPEVSFIADDNGASFGEGAPFKDGAAFYYYVAMRDLLGNPGPLSPGTLVTLCKRQPPESPRRVEVSNYRDSVDLIAATFQTRLRVTWRPHPTAKTNPPRGYRVSRWSGIADIAGGTPLRMSAEIPHVPGQRVYQYVDRLFNSPNVATDLATTFWYSVEAVEQTACGDLLSPPSAPGFGALRDVTGPIISSGSLHATASQLKIDVTQSLGPLSGKDISSFTGPLTDVNHLSVTATRNHPAVVSFSLGLARPAGDGEFTTNTLADVQFSDTTPSHEINLRIARSLYQETPPVFLWMRATDVNGREAYVQNALGAYNAEPQLVRNLLAMIGFEIEEQEITTTTSPRPGFSHQPAIPGTGLNSPIELSFLPAPDAREYKLYKTIDGGPRIFVTQGTIDEAPGTELDLSDDAFPPLGGKVCYFLQTFDSHGNPSPLAQLGCVDVSTKTQMPVPVLERAISAGTEANPQVLLRWFCPPDGVERFLVHIGNGLSSRRVPQPNLTTPRRSYQSLTGNPPHTLTGHAPGTLSGGIAFVPYQTGRVGGDFGDPGTPGLFEVLVNVVPGREYHFFLSSISSSGDASLGSNQETFTWEIPVENPAPQVPWPARMLPAMDQNFLPQLAAEFINQPSRFQGVGIRIGNYNFNEDQVVFGGAAYEGGSIQVAPTNFDDTAGNRISLFSTPEDETVFPCVVYRYEVDPGSGDAVTGDIVQVTPMIDGLWQRLDAPAQKQFIYQPHIGFYGGPSTGGVFIRDTQPVIRGSSYRYLVVRFKANGEIDRVLPMPHVQLPN